MRQGAAEICPVASPLFTSSRGTRTENPAHQNQANKYRTQGGVRDFTDFQRSCILFVSFCLSISVPASSSSWLCLLHLFEFFFIYLCFSTRRWKESKKSICTPERIEVAGAWEESYGNRTGSLPLPLCLSCSLTPEVFSQCLYWKLVCATVWAHMHKCVRTCVCVCVRIAPVVNAECSWLLASI